MKRYDIGYFAGLMVAWIPVKTKLDFFSSLALIVVVYGLGYWLSKVASSDPQLPPNGDLRR